MLCFVLFCSPMRIIEWCGCLDMTGPSKHKMSMFKILNCQISWMPTWRCLVLYLGSGLSERCVGHSFDMPQPGLDEHHSRVCKKHLQHKHRGFLSCVPHVWSCLVLIAGWGLRSNSVISRSEKELPVDLEIALFSGGNSTWKIFL